MTVTRPSKFVGICCVLAMMPAIVGCPTQSPPPAAQPKGESADHKDDVDFSGPTPESTEEELAEQARLRQEYEEFHCPNPSRLQLPRNSTICFVIEPPQDDRRGYRTG